MKRLKYLLFAIPLFAIASWELDFDDDFASASSAWSPLSLNPIVWYKGSSNVLDSSGNGYTGTGTNITYVSGINGSAFSLNGVSSKISTSIMPTKDPCSISFWYNIQGGAAVVRMVAVTKNATLDNLMDVYISSPSSVAQHFPLGSVFSTNSAMTGVWTHVVGVFSSSSTKLYINGKLNNTANTGVYSLPSVSDLQIGYVNYDGTDRQFFSGFMDDVLIFDKELTLDDISKIYAYRE